MTSRISKPDTDADRQLRDCLDQNPPISFVMVAGAGSGKTTSLVKALGYLSCTRGDQLRHRRQQIACITYTVVAVDELNNDMGNSALFHISTIHSFLWTVVQPFQSDIKEWVTGRLEEKIAEAREKISRPRTQERTRVKLFNDINRYEISLSNLAAVTRFTYGTGSDYSNGILGHDDIIKMGISLIIEKPLLRNIIVSRFPFIFVDESQDTDPNFIIALKQIATSAESEFCLGFFGDPMQKIYLNGAGPIELLDGWSTITKPENFRCPISVLEVINRIRKEDDQLVQIKGATIDGTEPEQGTARMFILPADGRRSERLDEVRCWLSEENHDPYWKAGNDGENIRFLVLVHRIAARRLGFADLYSSLNDNGASSLTAGLLDGTAWVLRPFMVFIIPLILSVREGNEFDVIAMLRAYCPLLSKNHLSTENVVELLRILQEDIVHLSSLFSADQESKIRDILTLVHNRNLYTLDDRFVPYLENCDYYVDDESSESTAIKAFLDCPAIQLWGYHQYVEDESPYATQQGVKGAEFDRVLAVLDDEESDYSLFSYGKYLGMTPLSGTDQENIEQDKDSVIDRTRRLFYVCCSRATKDLAVVLFVQDTQKAKQAIISKDLFPEGDIHVFDNQ